MVHGRGRTALAFPLTLLCFVGCHTLDAPPGITQSPAAETRASRSKELPPEQTAELAQATAEELEKQGNVAEAIAQYESARHHDPRRPVAHRLAVLYDRLGDDERALMEYDHALQMTPHNADLLNDRGYFHYQRGEWAEAEKWLRQALEADARHTRATINLGLVLGHEERYEESMQTFVRVLPEAQARCNVGVLLAQQGKPAAARDCLEEALRLDSHLKQAQVVLAKLDLNTSSANTPDSVTASSP
jgi:Tfp pilus assembly protein PilF